MKQKNADTNTTVVFWQNAKKITVPNEATECCWHKYNSGILTKGKQRLQSLMKQQSVAGTNTSGILTKGKKRLQSLMKQQRSGTNTQEAASAGIKP